MVHYCRLVMNYCLRLVCMELPSISIVNYCTSSTAFISCELLLVNSELLVTGGRLLLMVQLYWQALVNYRSVLEANYWQVVNLKMII